MGMQRGQRLSRRRFIVAGSTFAAAFAAACGGSGSGDKTEETTGRSGTPASGAAPAFTAASRNLNRSARITLNNTEIDSFDAVTGTGGNGQQFLWTVFDNLVAYDAKLKTSASRSLAESWEYVDPTTLRFKLRKGVTFHDGTPFNAEAVRANWQHVVKNGSRSGATADLQAIESVQTPDESAAVFKLKRPDGGLLVKLGDRPGFQSSPTAMEKFGADFRTGEYKRNPVGTGAFIFDGWQSSSFVKVKRNPNYWQKDCPVIEGVEWKIIPDLNTAFAGLRTGQLNVLWNLSADTIDQVKKTPGLQFRQQVGVSIGSLTLNTIRPPFNNPHAGRALSHAVDRKAIIDGLFHGTGRQAATWIGPGNAEYDPNYKGLWFDPAKVKEELTKAGMPNGFRFLLTSGVGPDLLQLLQAVQAQIAQFGFRMEIQQDAGYTGKFQDEHIGDAFYSNYSGRAEPSQSFNFKDAAAGVYVSGGTKPADPEFERMLADLESTLEPESRKTKLYKLADFVNDRGWDVFLWHTDTLAAAHETVSFEMFGDGKPHLGQCDVSVSM